MAQVSLKMMKLFQKKNKLFLFLIVIILFEKPLFAKKKPKVTNSSIVVNESDSLSDTAVKIPVINKKRTYFMQIDKSIMDDVENGSPKSIKRAMNNIRKGEAEYTDKERVLIYVVASVMEIVYPSEKITWNVVDCSKDNAYVGALNSVRNGVFDFSTGNEDFLSVIIPSLVFLKTNASELEIYEQCEKALKLALEMNSDSILANYLMGLFYESKEMYSEAEPYLKKAYEKESSCFEVGIAYSKALSKKGMIEEARLVVKNVAGNNEDNIEVLKQNAYIAFDNLDFEAADDYVTKVLQKNPNDLEFVLFKAKILIERNDYIHAVSLLDIYARQNTTDIDYLILRTKVQLDWSKNVKAATETIEKALMYYSENEEVLLLAAKVSSASELPVAGKMSDEYAAILLEKNPENSDALIYVFDGAFRNKEWRKAYDITHELIKNDKTNPDVVLRHVKACIQNKKNSEALDTAIKAYKENPDDETIIQAYVLAYSSVGNKNTAMSIINSMLPNASPKIKSFLYYRRSFLYKGEEDILADLRSSLIVNPRNSDSLFRLYEIYFNKKDYKKAQYYLRQIVAINPNDSSVKELNDQLTSLINQ